MLLLWNKCTDISLRPCFQLFYQLTLLHNFFKQVQNYVHLFPYKLPFILNSLLHHLPWVPRPGPVMCFDSSSHELLVTRFWFLTPKSFFLSSASLSVLLLRYSMNEVFHGQMTSWISMVLLSLPLPREPGCLLAYKSLKKSCSKETYCTKMFSKSVWSPSCPFI
jgi:hypothetical protein